MAGVSGAGLHWLHDEVDPLAAHLVVAREGLHHRGRMARVAAVPPKRVTGVVDLSALALDDGLERLVGVGADLHVEHARAGQQDLVVVHGWSRSSREYSLSLAVP